MRALRRRSRPRRDGRALRLLRARRPRRRRSHSRRRPRGRGRRRGAGGRAHDPGPGHGRGRPDRRRLRRHRPAARRQPQLPALGHALGLLLRRALPDRAGRPGLRGRLRSGDGPRSRGIARERPRARGGGRRERRDLVAHRRRRLRGLRPRPARPGGRAGDDEQRHARQRPLHVLRDDRRRPGRLPLGGRAVRDPRGDVEHALDTRRGARARLPAPRRAPRAPPRLGRRRDASAAATGSCASCACSRRAASLS